MDSIFHRVSVRRFRAQEVEPEKIERLLRAAMQAPSAANQQPWEFCVVRDPALLQQLAQTSPYAGPAAQAPLAIVVVSRTDSMIPLYNDIDCAIATENLMLEADSLGLGSVMLGIAPLKDRMQAVDAVLGLPENRTAFAIVAVGYPLEEHPQQERYDETRVRYFD